MSAITYFLKGGYTPINNVTVISGGNTIAVWSPQATKRVFITDMHVSSNTGGTIAFYFDNTTSYNFLQTFVGASASVSPIIGCIESTVVGGKIFARTTGNSTGGWIVNLTGFEIGD